MQINVPSVIGYSREQVFNTYRDELADLVEYLPNISKIDVVSREEPSDGVIKFENHWHADAPIPKIAQKFIKPEMLKWIDYATWDENAWTCHWKIQTMFMTEAVSCEGINTFEVKSDNEMLLTIKGDLTVNKIPGVPKLLAGTLKPAIEKFIIALITPNFQTINRGIEQHLQSK